MGLTEKYRAIYFALRIAGGIISKKDFGKHHELRIF